MKILNLLLVLVLVAFVGCSATTRQVSIVAANGDNVIVTINGKKIQLPAENVEIDADTIFFVYNSDNPSYNDSAIGASWVAGAYNLKAQKLVIPVYPKYELIQQGGEK